MTTNSDDGDDKKLKLKKPGKLELSKTVEQGQVKQSFSHGRSKQVSVEVKRKRTYQRGESGRMTEVRQGSGQQEAEKAFEPSGGQQPPAGERQQPAQARQQPAGSRGGTPKENATRTLEREQQRAGRTLTDSERQARLRALEQAERDKEERERRRQEEEERRRRQAEEEAKRREEEEKRRQA
ncbi:hypothetical protein CKO28_15335, partial [Rhodovibrio sodomensis]